MRQPLLIKVSDRDGLCNRLFPFAHLIACAQEHGFQVQHAAFFEFAQFFERTQNQLVPAFPGRQTSLPGFLKRTTEKAFALVQRVRKKLRPKATMILGDQETCDVSAPEMLRAIRANHTTLLSGLYYYDSRNFKKHADLVRAFFRPVAGIRERVTAALKPAREATDVLIGVHIRHGDYRTFCNGIMYYSISEYVVLMEQVAELFPGQRIAFLICCNEPVSLSEFGSLRVFLGPQHFVADLYALAACDYLMGPPSTFSEWASFYGRIPRYVHRANDYARDHQPWPGVRLDDFAVHEEGFARCSPGHVASLVLN